MRQPEPSLLAQVLGRHKGQYPCGRNASPTCWPFRCSGRTETFTSCARPVTGEGESREVVHARQTRCSGSGVLLAARLQGRRRAGRVGEVYQPHAGGVRGDVFQGERRETLLARGLLQLPSSISIREGRTSLDVYARIDGSGRGAGKSISIEVTSPGDIDDLWASATGKKTSYGCRSRSQSAQIDPDALRVRTKNGPATARDKIKLAFDITPTWHFQTGELYACRFHFARAEKV